MSFARKRIVLEVFIDAEVFVREYEESLSAKCRVDVDSVVKICEYNNLIFYRQVISSAIMLYIADHLVLHDCRISPRQILGIYEEKLQMRSLEGSEKAVSECREFIVKSVKHFAAVKRSYERSALKKKQLQSA